MKKDIIEGLKKVGLFLIGVLIIVYFGTRENTIGLIPASTVVCFLFSSYLAKWDFKNGENWIVRATVLGFLFGVAAHLAI